MRIKLRNLALAAVLAATGASFATEYHNPANLVLWEDDFEWLEPWALWKSYSDGKPGCGDAVGDNNPSAEAKNLTAPYIGAVENGTAVTAEQALIAKGYGLLGVKSPAKDAAERNPGNQIYLQRNYLKFGLTGFYSGIEIPVTKAARFSPFLEFDWCPQRQGDGNYDAVELVVIVKNGSSEVKIPVPFKQYATDVPMSWTHERIDLSGATINKDTRIIIRNADSQWPCAKNIAMRYFLDNIKIVDESPYEIIAEEDFEWFGTPFEKSGKSINNCPDETFDEVGDNTPGKASKWSSSQYWGEWSENTPEDLITAYDHMTRILGYEFEYVKAEGKKDRANIGSTVYIMKNYVKFGLTGYQANISIPARASVTGTAILDFDWAPQYDASKNVWDAVELTVKVRNGNTVKKTFTVPVANPSTENPMQWIHVSMPLEGVEINKGDFIQIGHADSQWPSSAALRWYLDNIMLLGNSKGDFDAPYSAPELYIKGDFNNWTADSGSKLATDGEVSIADYITYTYTADAMAAGKLQFATADGSISFGRGADGAITPDERYAMTFGDYKVEVPALTDVTVTVIYYRDHQFAPKVTISGTVAPDPVEVTGTRKAYAYDLSATLSQNGTLTVSYKSTDAAKSAAMLLFPEEGDAIVLDLPAPVKGQNNATLSVSDIASGSYMWQINITSEIEGNEAVVAYQSPEEWVPDENVNGGVVWIRDTQSPAYGYTVVGLGKAKGFAVYDPEGKLLTEKPVHAGFKGSDATGTYSNRSVFRGDAWGGKAVFADRAYGGAWVIDPLDLDKAPYNIFMAPGAVKNQYDYIIYDAQNIASQSTTIAFQGEGDDTKVFMYDLNLYYNSYGTLLRYDLGDNEYVTEKPSLVLSNYRSIMANLDIEVEPISTGFFVSQIRDDFNSGVFGLMYFDDNGTKVWDIANKGVLPVTTGHSISSGVAVNADETRLALSGYHEVYVFDLEFDYNGTPVLSNPQIYPLHPKLNSNLLGSKRQQLVFDAADNLHIFCTGLQGYTVLALPGETTASTPAKDVLSITSGIESVDATTDAPVEYYNLNGFRVSGSNLTPGIYIRRQGNITSKVVIR